MALSPGTRLFHTSIVRCGDTPIVWDNIARDHLEDEEIQGEAHRGYCEEKGHV